MYTADITYTISNGLDMMNNMLSIIHNWLTHMWDYFFWEILPLLTDPKGLLPFLVLIVAYATYRRGKWRVSTNLSVGLYTEKGFNQLNLKDPDFRKGDLDRWLKNNVDEAYYSTVPTSLTGKDPIETIRYTIKNIGREKIRFQEVKIQLHNFILLSPFSVYKNGWLLTTQDSKKDLVLESGETMSFYYTMRNVFEQNKDINTFSYLLYRLNGRLRHMQNEFIRKRLEKFAYVINTIGFLFDYGVLKFFVVDNSGKAHAIPSLKRINIRMHKPMLIPNSFYENFTFMHFTDMEKPMFARQRKSTMQLVFSITQKYLELSERDYTGRTCYFLSVILTDFLQEQYIFNTHEKDYILKEKFKYSIGSYINFDRWVRAKSRTTGVNLWILDKEFFTFLKKNIDTTRTD